MAFTPCAAHGKGYAGAASTFFLRLVDGGEQQGGKLQVCPNCATLFMEKLAESFQHVSDGDTFYELHDQSDCSYCHQDLNGSTIKLYGNAYPRGRRESQWFGQLCVTCVPAVVEDFNLDKAVQRQ
jgi:hypothetical protein